MGTRRGFMQQSLAAGGVLGLSGLRAEETPAPRENDGKPGMNIGIFIFPPMDQIDFTGPFEVLSPVPGATIHVLCKDKAPVRDIKGLILTPDRTLAEAPPLDVLVVPGGPGQEALMEDETVLSFIRERAAEARYVYSVCTGALVCGAAGLLKGVKSTTHWASFDLLKYGSSGSSVRGA